MHIPDGFLSPSTCATLTAAVSPFWVVAWKKAGNDAPRVGLAAAFAFVVMMFNVPLPGGTTGHVTGAALAGILLGPWRALLALTITLVLQAFFFGDGGVLALGVNCFNMALAAPFAAAAIYWMFGGNAMASARRQRLAAAAAGYASINVAALLTAIECGLQPLLFHTPSGTPLYCPYPLAISVPAMMFGHLTLLGLAEAAVTAGVLGYLIRFEPELLRAGDPLQTPRARLRWAALLAVALLVPLGLLAGGEAWGEWSAGALWAGLLNGYGGTWGTYVASAMIGVALCAAIAFALSRPARGIESASSGIARFGGFLAEIADAPPAKPGYSAAVFWLIAAAGVLIVNVVHQPAAILAAALLPVAHVVALATDPRPLLRRLRLAAPIIALLFAMPAIALIKGEVLWRLPGGISITQEGLLAALRVFLRACGSLAYVNVALLMTGASGTLLGLRRLGLPASLAASTGMAFRYVSVLARSAVEAELAWRSRSPLAASRVQVSRRIASVLRRTLSLSETVSLAVRSRGGPVVAQSPAVIAAKDIWVAALLGASFLLPIALECR